MLWIFAGCDKSPSAPPPASTTSNSPSSDSPATPSSTPKAPPSTLGATSPFRFDLQGKDAGIGFVHESGMTADRHFPTANGSGVAMLDYNGDGLLDLYFASCNLLPLAPSPKGSNRLYKNLGGNRYEDVTDTSGAGFRGFCHGVIAGDLDNDGDTDLILCNYGPNTLLVNQGDGTFKDGSKDSGLAVPNWSSGGAVLDYDNDGDLDVYISNYGSWDIETDGKNWCGNKEKNIRQYCSPTTIKTVRHMLYRNDGLKDGGPHFTDVTVEAGVSRDTAGVDGKSGYGHGFGVVSADLNGDGKTDLYVANDQNPAFVFLNKGDGTFEDATEKSGAAYDENGKTQSGMGVDAEDYNGDGLMDLVRTNFREETTSVYENQGGAGFLEQSAYLGVAAASLPWVKWGCSFQDFDNDGWPDLFVTNGHVDDNLHLVGITNQPSEQPPSLFLSNQGKKFANVSKGSGAYFDTGHVGRGASFGDLDNDGRVDIVVNHKGGAPAVLMNRSEGTGHWIQFKLQGTKSNRDAVGARVEIQTGDRLKPIVRQKKGGGSMESTNDPRILVGVGKAATLPRVVINWPSGGPDSVLESVPVDQTISVEEGKPGFTTEGKVSP